jgi:hypothetical protein
MVDGDRVSVSDEAYFRVSVVVLVAELDPAVASSPTHDARYVYVPGAFAESVSEKLPFTSVVAGDPATSANGPPSNDRLTTMLAPATFGGSESVPATVTSSPTVADETCGSTVNVDAGKTKTSPLVSALGS